MLEMLLNLCVLFKGFLVYYVVTSNIFLLTALCCTRSMAILDSVKRLADTHDEVNVRVKWAIGLSFLAAFVLSLPPTLETTTINAGNHVAVLMEMNVSFTGRIICRSLFFLQNFIDFSL